MVRNFYQNSLQIVPIPHRLVSLSQGDDILKRLWLIYALNSIITYCQDKNDFGPIWTALEFIKPTPLESKNQIIGKFDSN